MAVQLAEEPPAVPWRLASQRCWRHRMPLLGPAMCSHLAAEVDAHVHEGQRLGCRWRRDFHVVHAGHEVAREELEVPRLHLRRGFFVPSCAAYAFCNKNPKALSVWFNVRVIKVFANCPPCVHAVLS